MRKITICALAIGLTVGAAPLACRAAMPSRGHESNLKLIKRQQKFARKQLKLEEKIWKNSYRGRQIPRAVRLQEKHQLQRNLRDLRRQQKDQIQEIRDRNRVIKYRRTHPFY
ncbi:MAG: hypothetical protein KGM47_04870 [Acidobacteriota bacterium]|nr:hypothetical protein [Acidobacteriota bacterium]